MILLDRNGNIQARKIELVAPTPPPRLQGVVCSMKDSFGFIERADVVKEIFFHYSEFNDDINDLILGDDVEFDVQTRNVRHQNVADPGAIKRRQAHCGF